MIFCQKKRTKGCVPVCVLYFPSGHRVHSLYPYFAYVPAPHSTHAFSMEVRMMSASSLGLVPSGHEMQVVAPGSGWYMPTGQALQTSCPACGW